MAHSFREKNGQKYQNLENNVRNFYHIANYISFQNHIHKYYLTAHIGQLTPIATRQLERGEELASLANCPSHKLDSATKH